MGSQTTFKQFKCQWFLKGEVEALRDRSHSCFCGLRRKREDRERRTEITAHTCPASTCTDKHDQCLHLSPDTHMEDRVCEPSALSYRHRGATVNNLIKKRGEKNPRNKRDECAGACPWLTLLWFSQK